MMEPIPDDWIDRLFGCMSEFYGGRWNDLYKTTLLQALHKKIWKNGLHGLSYEQIKDTLRYYRRHAAQKHNLPPLVTEFHHFAKERL